MQRQLNKLNNLKAKALMGEPGRHSDGGGLYLSVSKDGSRRRWVFIYRRKTPGLKGSGRLQELGLGGANVISLAKARERATKLRMHLADGLDPAEALKPAPAVPTFGETADALIASKEGQWRNDKSSAQWRMTLSVYCAPIRMMAVDEIETDDVLSVLKPIWSTKPETAKRLRGRIENVLDVAKVRGFRTGDNPARYRGHLDYLLPRQSSLSRGHHKALPYAEVPNFAAKLKGFGSVSALCLEFTILTAARSGEAIGARWSEIDLDRKIWTIPASRMKAAQMHSVPLSGRACEIVRTMEAARVGEFVFPGQKADRTLSVMALAMVLRRLKMDVTVHGFRSTFRDWAAENGFGFEVAEAALAHTIRDKVQKAYFRTTLIENRRPMMEQWATYCGAHA